MECCNTSLEEMQSHHLYSLLGLWADYYGTSDPMLNKILAIAFLMLQRDALMHTNALTCRQALALVFENGGQTILIPKDNR